MKYIRILFYLTVITTPLVSCGGSSGTSECSDGIDNDGDGAIDDQDPGCAATNGESEVEPASTQCSDGVDNDGDGAVDFPQDRGCASPADDDEAAGEIGQCSDGIDNDNDGKIDFPEDPGCGSPAENSEFDDCPDGANCPECGNGVDDDGDGNADFPADPDCQSAGTSSESPSALNECGANLSTEPLPAGGQVTFSLEEGVSHLAGSCGGTGAEAAYKLTLTEESLVVASTVATATTADTVLYFRTDCRDPQSEEACNDNKVGTGGASELSAVLSPGEYVLVVDSQSGAAGNVALEVNTYTAPGALCDTVNPTCAPGFVCRLATQGAANTTCELPQCSDGDDFDGDGLDDYPNDPGCLSPDDPDERDDCPGPNCPQCSNGADDDGDTLADYPADPGCESAADGVEANDCGGTNIQVLTDNGVSDMFSSVDNLDSSCDTFTGNEAVYGYFNTRDLENLTFSADSFANLSLSVRQGDCGNVNNEIVCDISQTTVQTVSITSPGSGPYYVILDNVNTGGIGQYDLNVSGTISPGADCSPSDQNFICASGYYCEASSGTCEVADCNDGVNNDGDGFTDWPEDPGCATPSDNDETDDCPTGVNCPECSNTMDDDGDGSTDYPNDIGCASAGDPSEEDCMEESDPLIVISQATTSSNTAILTNDFAPSCTGGSFASDQVLFLQVPSVLAELNIDTTGSAFDTVLSIKAPSCSDDDMACSVSNFSEDANIQMTSVAPGTYIVVVDGVNTEAGAYNLNVDAVIQGGQTCDNAQIASGVFRCEDGYTCDGSSCVPTQCNDGANNDGDGAIDFPDDPGCTSIADDDETDDCPTGPNCPQCGNSVDDDGDGLTNYPADPGCESASDTLEVDDCIPGVPVMSLVDTVTGNTPTTGDGNFSPTCNTSTFATEDVYGYAYNGNLTKLRFTAVDPDPFPDTILSVRFGDCASAAAEVACADSDNVDFVEIANPTPGIYYVFVDGDFVDNVAYTLTVSGELPTGATCDPANTSFVCEPGSVCNGTTCAPTACNDGIDNDGDGPADFPNDPGCGSPDDNDETDDCPLGPNCPACFNGGDDDTDGEIDFPADDGCTHAADPSETDCPDTGGLFTVSQATHTGNTGTLGDDYQPTCGSVNGGQEAAYSLWLPSTMSTLTVDTNGSSFDTVLHMRAATCTAAELECDDDDGNGTQSLISRTNVAAGEYFIFVDGYGSSSGNYQLNVTGTYGSGGVCDPAATYFSCPGVETCQPNGANPPTCQ